MKKILIQIFIVIQLLESYTFILSSQQINPIQIDERVVLFTDRNLYIAGECIFFSAFMQSGNGTKQEEMSRVLYCELITPNGDKITGNKYLIEDSTVSGNLVTPDNITTGIYYLRAYTKLMRNTGPHYYHYTLIKIVNANRNEVQTVTENNYLSEPLTGGAITQKILDTFLISSNKSKYATRDTISITIDGGKTMQSSWEGLSLAVVPEFSISKNIVKLAENQQYEKRSIYYPETRGLSITGKLVDNITGNPLPGTRVNLSIIGSGRDFMAVHADTAGRFFFSLPDYKGYRDLFLCAEKTSTADPKLLVDNDFCTIPFHLPSSVFTLTRQEREAVYKMAVNVQLGSYFIPDSVPDSGIEQDGEKAFYGNPNEILYIDNYVQLPTLEEYFNELPTLVKVRKHQGEKYFKVLGTLTELPDLDPLVLVDLVAIDNPSKVLAISPTNISRIEVVNELYLKGDQTYGGIINIITKRGDFAGIDLPSSGIFINYEFLANICNDPKTSLLPHIPDTRNTLYWQPVLSVNKEKIAKVSFAASDTPGQYLVILNGINLKGEAFRQTATFEVMGQ